MSSSMPAGYAFVFLSDREWRMHPVLHCFLVTPNLTHSLAFDTMHFTSVLCRLPSPRVHQYCAFSTYCAPTLALTRGALPFCLVHAVLPSS